MRRLLFHNCSVLTICHSERGLAADEESLSGKIVRTSRAVAAASSSRGRFNSGQQMVTSCADDSTRLFQLPR